MAIYERSGLTGPDWLECLGQIQHYFDDVDEMDDETLLEESHRVEIQQPPTDDAYNDRDWRVYRRAVRQEMHVRGLRTPS